VVDAARKVRVLINPRSGLRGGLSIQRQMALEREGNRAGADMTYQFSHSIEDGQQKVRRAIADGVDTILVVGGDGMVNSIGSLLVGADVALGVLPTGSGNGFARHFNIPLEWDAAVRFLAHAERKRIDVGRINGRPFFVTCSMAWDGALVRWFEKSPIRGILPYALAAAYEYLEFAPQPFVLRFDDGETWRLPDPQVCTVANLTQFGGGAIIAPQARADDGLLELVTVARQDMPAVLTRLPQLFAGKIHHAPEVRTRRFRRLVIERERTSVVQVDGELTEFPARLEVDVQPAALWTLVPRVST